MTDRLAIVAFPRCESIERLERIRQRFDPLAATLAAHVTLVFPFGADIDEAVVTRHIEKATEGISAFVISFGPPEVVEDEYVWLPAIAGRETLITLHRRLYSGLLERHLSPRHVYSPHMTVGRISSPEARLVAAEAARVELSLPVEGSIDSISLFRLTASVIGTTVSTTKLSAGE